MIKLLVKWKRILAKTAFVILCILLFMTAFGLLGMLTGAPFYVAFFGSGFILVISSILVFLCFGLFHLWDWIDDL